MKIIQNISGVRNKYVKTIWFEQINSGTSGTITPPEHGEILLNEWAGGIDAVTSTLSGGVPTYDSAETSGGTVITSSMDVSGNWSISGTPSSYPIGIIYAYRTQLIYFDYTKSLLGDVVEGTVGEDSAETLLAAGVYTLPSGVSNGDGTYTIGTGVYYLYHSVDGSGDIFTHTITGGTYTPTSNVPVYVVANYNGGSPILQLITDSSLINWTTIRCIFTLYKNSANNFIDMYSWGEAAKANDVKVVNRFQNVTYFNGSINNFVKQSGFELSDTGSGVLRIEGGILWNGITFNNLEAHQMGTSGHYMREWVYNGSAWLPTVVTAYDNMSYQGASGKLTLPDGHYGVIWVLKKISTVDALGNVAGYQFGTQGFDSVSEAISATIPTPSTMPSIFITFGILIGRIIFQKGGATVRCDNVGYDIIDRTYIPAFTGDLTESTDKNYVNDNVDDAVSGANSPSVSNVFATMNDIPVSIDYVTSVATVGAETAAFDAADAAGKTIIVIRSDLA
jgi:hypothetical protein